MMSLTGRFLVSPGMELGSFKFVFFGGRLKESCWDGAAEMGTFLH